MTFFSPSFCLFVWGWFLTSPKKRVGKTHSFFLPPHALAQFSLNTPKPQKHELSFLCVVDWELKEGGLEGKTELFSVFISPGPL